MDQTSPGTETRDDDEDDIKEVDREDEETTAFELWLKNEGSVSGLHFIWACHGLRSLVESESETENVTPTTTTTLVESVYREWILSGELNLSNHILRSTIALLLPLCRPHNLEAHLSILRNIEGHVQSHIVTVLKPQFQLQKRIVEKRDNLKNNIKSTDKLDWITTTTGKLKRKQEIKIRELKSKFNCATDDCKSGLVVINEEDGLQPTSLRPPPPSSMNQDEFVEQLVSRLEALTLKTQTHSQQNNGQDFCQILPL